MIRELVLNGFASTKSNLVIIVKAWLFLFGKQSGLFYKLVLPITRQHEMSIVSHKSNAAKFFICAAAHMGEKI